MGQMQQEETLADSSKFSLSVHFPLGELGITSVPFSHSAHFTSHVMVYGQELGQRASEDILSVDEFFS